jgi:hypothetical protein
MGHCSVLVGQPPADEEICIRLRASAGAVLDDAAQLHLHSREFMRMEERQHARRVYDGHDGSHGKQKGAPRLERRADLAV